MPVALLVAFAGLFAAATLSLGHVLDLPVPCGGRRGCGAVASHPASRVMGVPIAHVGVAGYVVMVLLLVCAPAWRAARVALVVVSGVGAATSAVLLAYSHRVIEATCLWCVASGAAMFALFLCAVAIAARGSSMRTARPALVWAMAVATAAAVGAQAGLMQRAANAPPIAARLLAGLGADDLVDPGKALGPPDAPVTIVMFGDPWCGACAGAHAALSRFRLLNPGAIRLAYRHLPLWEASGAAAAVGEIAAEHGKFWEFIGAVYARRVPPMGAGYAGALRALGIEVDDLEARVADATDPAVRRVWNDVALADRLGVESTPTFIVLLDGKPPVSATMRTLPRILNAPEVASRLMRTDAH